MATKTVAAGGGNFNVGATWVGGVAPVAGDDIIANATSGNLNIGTSTAAIIAANFTGYTGTLSLNTNQFNLQSGSTLTLSSTMTITSGGNGGRLQFASGTSTLSVVSGICRVPNIHIIGTLTISGAGELYLSGNNNAATTNGNSFTWYGTTSPIANLTLTSPQFCFIKPDTTLTLSNSLPFSRTVFASTASITTTGSILSTFASSTYIRFDATPAFSAGVPLSYITSTGALTHTIDVATSSVKITRLNIANNSANLTTTFYFPTSTDIGKMLVRPYFAGASDGTRWTTNMLSNSNISVDELILSSDYGSFTSATAEIQVQTTTSRNNTLRLSSGATWSISSIHSSGVSGLSPSVVTVLSSMTASVPATITIGSTFSFDNTQIIDINNVGTSAYAFTFANNTLTRTTGISSTLPSGGTGGAGGSFTFVN